MLDGTSELRSSGMDWLEKMQIIHSFPSICLFVLVCMVWYAWHGTVRFGKVWTGIYWDGFVISLSIGFNV